jgi:hypothetical protein
VQDHPAAACSLCTPAYLIKPGILRGLVWRPRKESLRFVRLRCAVKEYTETVPESACSKGANAPKQPADNLDQNLGSSKLSVAGRSCALLRLRYTSAILDQERHRALPRVTSFVVND